MTSAAVYLPPLTGEGFMRGNHDCYDDDGNDKNNDDENNNNINGDDDADLNDNVLDWG